MQRFRRYIGGGTTVGLALNCLRLGRILVMQGFPVVTVVLILILGCANRVFGGMAYNTPNRYFLVNTGIASPCDTNVGYITSNSVTGSFDTNVSYNFACLASSEECGATNMSWVGLGTQSMLVTASSSEEASYSFAPGDSVQNQDLNFSGTVQFSVDSTAGYALRVGSLALARDNTSGHPDVSFDLGDLSASVSLVSFSSANTNMAISSPMFFSGTLTNGHTYQVSYRVGCEQIFFPSVHLAHVSASLQGFEFEASTISCSNSPPTLEFSVDGSNLTLSWPICPPGMYLQVADSIADGGNWAWEPTSPVLLGDDLTVTVGMTNGARFYRLKGS